MNFKDVKFWIWSLLMLVVGAYLGFSGLEQGWDGIRRIAINILGGSA